jgi:hypothetical protein
LLDGKIVHLQEYEEQLIQRTMTLKERIQQVHAIQVQYIAQQLNDTIATEAKTRQQSVESDLLQEPNITIDTHSPCQT